MAWGGTGGHVFPIRSLLETLFKTPSYASQVDKIYRFGSRGSLEEEVVQTPFGHGDVIFQSILSWKYRRQKTIKAFFQNLKDVFLFSFGFLQSLRYLRTYRVDVVFCKGGYVALPVVFAAKLLRKKIIVHESDVHPGMVNRIASRYTSATFTGFDNVLPNAITVGQILSDDITPQTPFRKGGNEWSDERGRPTVFIMGGSQGSRILYETFAELLQTNVGIASSFNFFITLWKLNNNLKPLFSQQHVHCFDFLSQKEMGELYQISDICLARGWTTSLAEQKLFNIKSIIVPIPRTHDQMDNAKRYVHHHSDILLDQTSPTFLQDMEKVFLSLTHYHKPPIEKDIFTEIQQAKKLIWEEILK